MNAVIAGKNGGENTKDKLIYLVYCKECDDFTKWDSIDEAQNQRFRHYWKQHENVKLITITEYSEIRKID